VYSNEDKEKYKLLLEYDNEYHELYGPPAKPVKPNEEEKAKKEKEEEERKKRQAEEEKENKRQAEEEEKKRLAEEGEKKRKAEEDKKRLDEEQKKKKEEEEQKKKKEDEDARLAIIAKQQEDDDKKRQAERIKEEEKAKIEGYNQLQSSNPIVEPQSKGDDDRGLNTIPINNIGGIIRTVPAKEEDKLTSNENEKELILK